MFRRWNFLIVGLIVLALGVHLTPAQAQSSNSWTAQYYNNTNFSGSPAATTTIGSNLNVNWGQSAPANGVGVDNWTARFNTISYFNAGTYRFTINADDAFRLFVHGNQVTETISNPQPNQTRTVDVTMAAGNAGIQIDYREYVGNAFLYVSWQQISGNVPPVQQPPVQIPGSGIWQAHYYNNTSLSGSPFAVTSVDSLNLNWGNNAPINGMKADDWTARFFGNVYFNPGTYRFNINADDAFRLYVQNQLVKDTFVNPQADKWISVDVVIAGGNTTIQLDYREYIGPAFLNASWQQINNNTQPTPQPQNPVVPQVTVTTGSLNVRSAPFIGDNVITQIPNRATYPLIGRTASNDWYQIRVGQSVGWVSARYVVATTTANVPVVNAQVSAPIVANPTGYTLRATANVNMRAGSVITAQRLSILPNNAVANILARNASNSWWLVSHGGASGWVNSAYVAIPANINYSQIPVR